MTRFRRRVSWLALGVVAVLGVGTCEDCDPATVDSSGPKPAITSPEEGQQYFVGDTVWFRAIPAQGARFEAIDGSWTLTPHPASTSIIPGTVSATVNTATIYPPPSSFTTREALPPGTYSVRFEATMALQGSDWKASDMVSFTVVAAPNQPPQATITLPAADATVASGPVTLAGTGTDPEDGALPDAALAWSSSLDGALGTGASLSHPGLSLGAHVLTLTATDSQGATGTASINLTVADQAGGAIQGTVTVGGQPRAGVTIALSGRATATTTTASDGSYAFTGLAFGEYLVSITPPAGAEFPVIHQTVFVPAGQTVVVNFAGT